LEFSGELWVERDDYLDDAPRRNGFGWRPARKCGSNMPIIVTVEDVIRNDDGEPVEILCTYDPESRGGSTPDGRKVRGTLHWLSRHDALDAEVRLYDHLITLEDVEQGGRRQGVPGLCESRFRNYHCESSSPPLPTPPAESRFQFLRNGYFVADRVDHGAGVEAGVQSHRGFAGFLGENRKEGIGLRVGTRSE
jgi:glutaminyl-tRNA synthetase